MNGSQVSEGAQGRAIDPPRTARPMQHGIRFNVQKGSGAGPGAGARASTKGQAKGSFGQEDSGACPDIPRMPSTGMEWQDGVSGGQPPCHVPFSRTRPRRTKGLGGKQPRPVSDSVGSAAAGVRLSRISRGRCPTQ